MTDKTFSTFYCLKMFPFYGMYCGMIQVGVTSQPNVVYQLCIQIQIYAYVFLMLVDNFDIATLSGEIDLPVASSIYGIQVLEC